MAFEDLYSVLAAERKAVNQQGNEPAPDEPDDTPPSQLGDAFSDWREEARSALGILAAALDERVAVEERFEDMINLHGGLPISSADVRMRLRTFLPFDVGPTP